MRYICVYKIGIMDISGLQVIYEDNHLIAVNKPVGWLVQGDRTGDLTLMDMVKEYIRLRYQKPGAVFLGLIHRLDRPVSGALVFARTSKALSRMNKLFQERKVSKTYLAIVDSRPDPLEGTLSHFIWKDKSKNRSKALIQPGKRHAGAKPGQLSYSLVGSLNNKYLLRVAPLTGRPHQIRVQLASIDCPISGDLKYGSKSKHPDTGIYLHCHSLSFEHPVKREPIVISADPPEDAGWASLVGIYQQ